MRTPLLHLLHSTILIISSSILLGCAPSTSKEASKVDPKSITSEYYVDYDEDTNILNIIVEFRAGTTYLTLDKGAFVSWDGEILQMVSDPEINYTYYKLSKNITSSDDLYTTHLFTYRNHEEKLFTNHVTVPIAPSYLVTESTPITVKMSWQISDQIAADGLGTTIDKMVNSSLFRREEFFITTEATQNSGTFFVPTSIVEKFGPGSEVEITICRKRKFSAEGTPKGGFMLTKSCGKTISANIPKE